jgi:AhpD family alkylhydroperoxidase
MPSSPSVPVVDVPASIVQQLTDLGAGPEAATNLLYRTLANNPDQLVGWVEMAWRLRQLSETPLRLRELMILRGAQLSRCEFERIGHTLRARAAGVSDDVIDQVATWRTSTVFSADELVAFALIEEMLAGAVSDASLDDLAAHFDVPQQIELILTAGFYAMVPRVIDALRLVRPPEG